MKLLTLTLTLSILFIAISCGPSDQKEKADTSNSEWITLFDGKTLEGWEQKNGTATYEVVDGTVVGTTSDGSPNSFLCTKKEYADFELTLEVKVDTELNSGIQIRSSTKEPDPENENYKAVGRVFGPQVEIAEGDSTGGVSGYIWREATGDGWMGEGEPKRHPHFNGGEWNSYRIVAKGPQITTWINGNMVEDVTDPETHEKFPSGFISLQVHSIRKGTGPYQVAWRNIKIREL